MEPTDTTPINKKRPVRGGLILLLLAVLLAAGSYFVWLFVEQRDALITTANETRQLSVELGDTKIALQKASTTVAALTDQLNLTAYELDELESDYRKEKRRNDNLADDLEEQEKLASLDEQLLQKYSKVYFLNENYTPSDVDKISSRYILPGKEDQYFHEDAIDYLEDMLDEASDDDIELLVVSAYRSFDEQSVIKGQFTNIYGSGANAFSADQGYSEHQLGTTVDLTTKEIGGTYTSFANTEAFKWLKDNAHKYGFVLSYPEGNNFYIFEPWHWRFVGEDLADDLDDDNDNFYDWDQRKIDRYLIKIFD
ncbi:M15 family metallopeptidase [Candidatus Pacebacteria bacterium]|nr:M15 family metallopeptidase [Candidatus Paceibacterota bacterium]